MSAAEEREKTAAVVASDGAVPVPFGPGPLPLSDERLAEIGSLDLLALMDDGPAGIVSGHLAALLAEVDRLRGLSDHLRESRNRFRDQRNGVFDTNRKLLAELELEQVARLRAENESRTQVRESAALRARVAELEAAAEQIRHLHKDSPMGPCPVCVDADAMGRGEDYTLPFPCPTARLAGAKDCDPPSVDVSADKLTRLLAPTQAPREAEAVGRSVDAQFPVVAAFLADAEPTADADRIVAYRDPSRRDVLLCREHGAPIGWVNPVTSEDLPDGGFCTYGRMSGLECGRDVLAEEHKPGGAS